MKPMKCDLCKKDIKFDKNQCWTELTVFKPKSNYDLQFDICDDCREKIIVFLKTLEKFK